ncbi:MAG: hypothetical protein ACYTEZ_12715 [Planctomycetota bacterium]|jgi:hypothetical protein
MPLAIEAPPWEIILFLVAALIAIANRIVEAARSVRRKSLDEQRRRTGQEGVRFEEPKPPPAVPTLPFPSPTVPPRPPPSRPPRRRPPPRLQLGREELAPAPDLLRMAKPLPPAPPPHARKERLRELVEMLRGDPSHLQDAILIREILGPPRAFRGGR